MDNRSSWSCTFELEDIEIIDHKTENEDKLGKWHCDQCSLFFLEKGKLDEHKKKHSIHDIVKCKYCNKTISSSSVNRECYVNRKCETCEYKCSNCPQRFLRHSSLMNHEKKHSSPKKKRTMKSNKKINGTTAENIAVSKGLKKKQTEVGDLEHVKELKPKKTLNMKSSPKIKVDLEVNAQTLLDGEKTPIKKPRRLSLKACKTADDKDNCEHLPVKTPKRLILKTNKQLEEKNSDIKSKQSTITFNTQTVSPTSNVTNSENVVNYKPFSCHVCGDTFASDSALLDHIRTHGENAAKSFKCKFCGDEFDDIYKMQYHLAICPLAEDELESSLKQVIPTNIPTKWSGATSSPRKRGRPKKIIESPLDQEQSMTEPTSSSKRGNFRKRKSDDKESNVTEQNSSEPSLPKQSKRSQNKKPLSRSDSIRVAEDTVHESTPGDITEVIKESELEDEKKKLHQCPFPRCDFKFTREKALLCHMRNHSDDFDDSLKCHKCDIPFDDIHTLRLHINSCKGIKEERDDDFNRADCYDTSPNRTFHRTKRDFVCNQCGRSYQNQEKLNSHQCIRFEREPIVKKDLRRHKCNVCQAEFQSELEENDHMVTHTRKVAAEHLCLRCFNYFKHTSMQQHKCGSQIMKSARTLIELSICQNNFTPEHIAQMFNSTDSKLSNKIYASNSKNRHVQQNRDQLFLCRICKLSFVSKKMYIKHRKSHGEKNKTICSSCNGKFSSQKLLKIHQRKHLKQFVKCPICSKEFCDRISFAKHTNDDHVKDMNKFDCEICNLTIYDASAVMDHFMFHNFGISVDKNSPKYLEVELDMDSPKEKEIDRCHKLNRNGKIPTRKLGCRPSFYRNKKLTTFDTSKRYVNGFPGSLRIGEKHVTERLEPNKFLTFKENVKNEDDSVGSKEDFMELRNKENVPDNLPTEITGDSIENSITEKFTVLNKQLIKSCYIPLVNVNFDSTDCTSNASKNKEESEVPERVGQTQVSVRCIKMEKDNDKVICDAKVIEFNCYGHSESFETNISLENNNSKDLDDSVVIVDHLKVHKCSLCSEIFESIEFLRYHVVVHM